MSFLDGWWHRVRVFFSRNRYQRELDEQARFHLSLEAMQQEHAGQGSVSPEAAAAGARRRFGNLMQVQEATREAAGLSWLDAIERDLVFAVRTLRRAPGFTAVAVLTLGLGIGANTALFSAVHTLLLRPLPFPEPDRLMMVNLVTPPGPDPSFEAPWSYPKFAAARDAQQVFQNIAVYQDQSFTVQGPDGAERNYGELAGAAYFTILGVHPVLGRPFLAEEDRHPGGPRVALISDAFWQRRFNAVPSVLGLTITVDGDPYTIVGVLPPEFRGLSGHADFWLPVLSQPAEEIDQAWNHSYTVIGRLKPGISLARALAAAQELGIQVDRAYPNPTRPDLHWGAVAHPLDTSRVDPVVRRSVLILFAAVALLLLMASANVANLFLVRATGRRREIAVRLAMGAGRSRLIRQLLTESLVLAGLSGTVSLFIAWGGIRALRLLDPGRVLGASDHQAALVTTASLHLDLVAVGFAAALALTIGLLFGLVPAFQATNLSLTGALKDETGRSGFRSDRWSARNVLVVIQTSIAVVLLAGSGLMLKSLHNLLSTDPGFDADHVLTLRFNVPPLTSRDSFSVVYDRVMERVRGLPGVTGVGLSDCVPLSGGCSGTVIIFRDHPPPAPGTEPSVGVHLVNPEWFSVARVPLLQGQLFSGAEERGSRKVMLVNAAAARRFWPNQSPLGRPVSIGFSPFWKDTAYVIGVVGDVRFRSIDSAATPDVYISYRQLTPGRQTVFVRTAGDPKALAAPARQAAREAAPGLPVYDVATLQERIARATLRTRFSATLLGLFAAVAVALATLGVYGVISFSVLQRTREIGIRSALGAARGNLLGLVVGQGARFFVVGAVVGVGVALGSNRVLSSLLYGVAPTDPSTLGFIVVLLGVAVLAASWIPARRAARIDPMAALRDE